MTRPRTNQDGAWTPSVSASCLRSQTEVGRAGQVSAGRSGDLPSSQEDNMAESLSLCRVSHTDLHPLTSVPLFYYKIKDFLDRRFLP